jgi:cytochrome P450
MRTARLPPGPRGRWLSGNLLEFRRDMLGFLSETARTYGDLASFRLGPRRVVLASHPDLIEQVLVSDNRNFGKHYALQFLRPVLGNGLLTSEGDLWLRQRRLMQPAFLRQRLEGYGPVMVDRTRRLMAGWHDQAVRDAHADMTHLALQIAAKALLDVEGLSEKGSDPAEAKGGQTPFRKASDESQPVGRALDVLMQDFTYRFVNAFPLPRWLPTPWNRRVRKAIGELEAIIYGIIERRRHEPDRGDLLSVLVRARDQDDGRGMDDRQLRDEVMTMFLAGHETTANALAWTVYLLAQHPEAEARLVEECRSVLDGRDPTPADIPALRYTESVFLESMRLYPPAYIFGRRALRECRLGDYDLPAQTTVLISQWVLHRDGRFFDRPEQFEPERWLTGLAQRLPRFAYLPFGGGPRGCIGNTFAMMEGVLILATLFPAFGFSLAPGPPVRPRPSVTLRPATGIRVVLRKRMAGKEAASAAEGGTTMGAVGAELGKAEGCRSH